MPQANHTWLLHTSTEKIEGDADLGNAILIVKVARNSPADTLGLVAGDYVTQIDGKPGSSTDLLAHIGEKNTPIDYVFYDHSEHSYQHIKTTNIPLGFVAEPSTPSLLRNFEKGDFSDTSHLGTIWARQEWGSLLKAAKMLEFTGLLFRFIRLFKKNFAISSEQLFKGAALYELGKEEEAMQIISKFMHEDMHRHETIKHAIAYFYQAKWAGKNNDPVSQQNYLKAAGNNNRYHFDRITQEVQQKCNQAIDPEFIWKGQAFPIDYALSKLESTGDIWLQNILHGMSTEQFLPVCVMPLYRGNGPYDFAMHVYRAIYPHIASRLKPMHIIIDSPEKSKGNSWWYENEDLAAKAGVPFELLYDPDRTVSGRLDLAFSPQFFVLNNQGIVHYEGSLASSYDYWNMLNRSSDHTRR